MPEPLKAAEPSQPSPFEEAKSSSRGSAADAGGLELGAASVQFDITEEEQEDAVRRSAVRAVVVHEAIRKEGEEELRRPISALAWSGLAAGLSMGFSLVTEGLFRSSLPDAPWRPLIAKLGYPVGFLIVVL